MMIVFYYFHIEKNYFIAIDTINKYKKKMKNVSNFINILEFVEKLSFLKQLVLENKIQDR
jgi:DNA integrity scanning protein DisA with diadenylate cyclase activity